MVIREEQEKGDVGRNGRVSLSWKGRNAEAGEECWLPERERCARMLRGEVCREILSCVGRYLRLAT